MAITNELRCHQVFLGEEGFARDGVDRAEVDDDQEVIVTPPSYLGTHKSNLISDSLIWSVESFVIPYLLREFLFHHLLSWFQTCAEFFEL